MAFFTNKYNQVLYVTSDFAESKAFLAFLVPPGGTSPAEDPELNDALTNPAYKGIFIFSTTGPVLETDEQAKAFYDAIISNTPQTNRSIGWAQHVNDPRNLLVSVMGISDDGSQVISGLQADLTGGGLLLFNIPNFTTISLSGTTLQLSSNTSIAFSGPFAPVSKPIYDATIDCVGNARGCINCTGYLRRDTIMDDAQSSVSNGLIMGFEYLFPSSSDKGESVAGFFPLAYPLYPSNDFLGFTISVDPTDTFNKTSVIGNMADAYNSRRTWFNFTGTSFGADTPIHLDSYYSTVFGASANLIPVVSGNEVLPARLVLCQGENFTGTISNFYLAPEGDFAIAFSSTSSAQDNCLMCGIQGTEFFYVTPQTDTATGDTLRFISRSAAFTPGYPFPTASPVGAPANYDKLPMNTSYTTSWATLLPTSGTPIIYVAQPKGAALFGKDQVISNPYPSLFGHTTPGFVFTPDNTTLFPLLPYAGTFTGDGYTCFSKQQMEEYERVVISPVRRKQVGQVTSAKRISASASKIGTTDGNQTLTTPSGLLVSIATSDNQVKWQNVLLGQNEIYKMQFVNPDDKLIEALQTGDLFLVATNAAHTNSRNASFQNTMDIGGWKMQVNVGYNNAYGDYKNIIIIKGKKGKLFDVTDPNNGLVANPNKWTLPNDFAAPSFLPGTTGIDASQLVNVSQWLQSYFQEAASKAATTDYFDSFNALANDENWTGILFLRLDIITPPDNLSGIVAGVADPLSFNVHHLAIPISAVKNKDGNAVLEHPSSMSGLIYYVDPNFTDAPPYTTLASNTTAPFDFRVLTLKVLFENTAVKRFGSYSQLTLKQFFGAAVTAMGDTTNLYDNVLLKGSFQMNGSTPVYNLSSDGNNIFYLNSNIIQKIEVSKAVLTALNSTDTTTGASRFDLSGFIEYIALENTDSTPFDLFSFDGLFFEHLSVKMVYPLATPSNKTFTFETGDLTFDSSRSTPRKLSLFTNFALDEVTLLSGTKEQTPDKKGFINVVPDMRLSGVSRSDVWYGLKLRLNLGTPGDLANKANLAAYLLLAWTPASVDNSYQAGVYISLPGTSGGASLISLQNVLKLSIGQIRLTYDTTQSSFLLMLTEIALKFLGLLKIPPNGSTLFYLFGNPNANGKASGLGWYAMYRQGTGSNALEITN